MIKIFGIVFDKILIILFWFAGILLAFTTVGTCVDTLCRYLFNKPIPWMLELTEYIMLYIPFLTAAIVLKEKGHIKIDLMTEHLSPKNKARISFIASLVGGLTMLIYTVFGASVTFDFFMRGVLSLEYLKLPAYLVLIVIPVGSFFMMVQFFRDSVNGFQQIRQQN
jgi:C4-dicarboxylate transporter DctQ subunit